MTYRMYLKKNDPTTPIPKKGDLFRVEEIYISTDELFRVRVDVHLVPVSNQSKPGDNASKVSH